MQQGLCVRGISLQQWHQLPSTETLVVDSDALGATANPDGKRSKW